MAGQRGRFLTLEGGEGVGKSTQARWLAEALRARGLRVLATREPGGAPGAEAIRRLLVEGDPRRWDGVTEALLHFAARRNHLVATIRPALAAGHWVVCDRFTDSTMAYQGCALGVGRDVITALAALTLDGLVPDLTIILDLPVAEGLGRTQNRHGPETRYEQMDPAFHDRVRTAFLDIAQSEPERCAVIDAGAGPETVFAAVLAVVDQRLAPG